MKKSCHALAMNCSKQKIPNILWHSLKKLFELAYFFDPEDLGGDRMLEHAAYELLPLQLLILVLVAHVVHLRHHCSQINLQNRREKNIKTSRMSTFTPFKLKDNSYYLWKGRRKVITEPIVIKKHIKKRGMRKCWACAKSTCRIFSSYKHFLLVHRVHAKPLYLETEL